MRPESSMKKLIVVAECMRQRERRRRRGRKNGESDAFLIEE